MMDKLTGTAGAISCRLSTWDDPEIRTAVPFSTGLEVLHAKACELPSDPCSPELAPVIDNLVSLAITTDTLSTQLHVNTQANVEEKFAKKDPS